MEGYEIYRLSDEEIQHVGVKGMKWGKRKSRSSYMRKVDAHENKTKSVAAAKSTSGSAKRKAYMDAVRANDNKGKAIRDAKAKEKTDKKSATSYMDKVRAHENKTKAVAAAKSESDKRAINNEKRKPKVKLSKDEKDAIAEEKFWAKDAKDKARVERNKARMAKVMGQKAVDVLTAPENRVKIAAVTSILAAYEGTQMGSAKHARLMREFNSHNYKI